MASETGSRVKKKAKVYRHTTVLFDKQERKVVAENAEAKGQSISTYVRAVIREKHGLGDFGSVAAG